MESIGKIKRHFSLNENISCLMFSLSYILKEVNVGYFSSINQLFLHNLEQ